MNLHKWNKTFLISLLLVGLAIYVPGSPSRPDIRSLYFEVISTQDKLPNSVIRCIDQDSIGFLWFGSNDGLFLYDITNRKTQHFRYHPQQNTLLPDREVLSLFIDDRDNLWIGTRENGLSIAAIADIMRDGEEAPAVKYQTGTSGRQPD